MPLIDLTNDDRAVLAELLRETIERDRYPLSPRIRTLKRILAKLETSGTTAAPSPKRLGEPSAVPETTPRSG